MKKMFYSLAVIAVFALTLVANVASASACFWGHYQPEVPEALHR